MYIHTYMIYTVIVKSITSGSLRLSSTGNQGLHVLALLFQVPRSAFALYHLVVEPHLEGWRRAMQETKLETTAAQAPANNARSCNARSCNARSCNTRSYDHPSYETLAQNTEGTCIAAIWSECTEFWTRCKSSWRSLSRSCTCCRSCCSVSCHLASSERR